MSITQASVDVGYCTTEDVREVLQETSAAFGSNELDTAFVEAAILGESERIQETTNRHWYVPTAPASVLVSDSPRTHSEDEQDIKAGPHAGNSQLFEARRTGQAKPEYPVLHGQRYTRVQLFRRDVSAITELLVRQTDGSYDDWTTDPDIVQGRGEDYYLQVNDSTGITYLYLNAAALSPLSDYGAAVIATYEYGVDELPKTVRQATASRAAASLLREDETKQAIPDDGQLVSLDSKADELEDRAERLMKIHM
jgi:hypothetical protein